MTTLFLDFETFYDAESGYSLKKMPTAQYVRDPRFRVLGASIGLGREKLWLEPEPLEKFLRAMPWELITLSAHNAAFDGLILTQHYNLPPPKSYFCTMLAARYAISQGLLSSETTTSLAALAPIVHEEKGDLDASIRAGDLATYALQDLNILQKLHVLLFDWLPPAEREYLDLHVRMSTLPALVLDIPRLQRLQKQDETLADLFPVVRQDEKFAAMLAGMGVNAEYKTTAKGTYKLATSKKDDWLDKLEKHADPRVRKLVEIRRKASSTIERTRAQRFIDVGSPLPVPLLYYGAHTGRASGQDKLNLQNLPREGEMRGCAMAPEGHKLVIVDSSQIEVRVLAWLAGEEVLLDLFREGKDPYIAFAADHLYKVPREEVTKAQRQVGKAAVLALGFGQGANGFLGYCEGFNIPMDATTAHDVVRAYRSAYKRIVAYWRKVEDQVRLTGETILPSGRKLTYPEMRMDEEGLAYRRASIFRKAKSEGFSNLWHGKLVENCVQAAARDVVFAQSVRLHRKGYHLAMMVHDETVLIVPDAQVDQAVADCKVAFGSTPKWAPGLPVAGEVVVSERYVK